MCARFTVLNETPIAAAIAGWVMPLSRSNTIWMRWRCDAGSFHRSAVFSFRTSLLVHLTICSPESDDHRIIPSRLTGSSGLPQISDSISYGSGMKLTSVLVIRGLARRPRTRNPVTTGRGVLDSGFASAALRRPGMTPMLYEPLETAHYWSELEGRILST